MMDNNFMFQNQKKCWELIKEKPKLLEILIEQYDIISTLHGSGKDYIGKNNIYNEFMETKWCMVYDKMLQYKGR